MGVVIPAQRGHAVALAVAAGAGVAFGNGRHVGAGAKVGLVPAGLTQPLEEATAAAGVERSFDLSLGDARRLPNEHDPRFRAAAEDRPRDDPVALLQAVTAGAQLIMEESQIDCRVRIHHKILTQGHQGARRNPHSPKFGAALARRDDAPG